MTIAAHDLRRIEQTLALARGEHIQVAVADLREVLETLAATETQLAEAEATAENLRHDYRDAVRERDKAEAERDLLRKESPRG